MSFFYQMTPTQNNWYHKYPCEIFVRFYTICCQSKLSGRRAAFTVHSPFCLASMHPKPSVKMVQFMASQHHIRHNKFLLELRFQIKMSCYLEYKWNLAWKEAFHNIFQLKNILSFCLPWFFHRSAPRTVKKSSFKNQITFFTFKL